MQHKPWTFGAGIWLFGQFIDRYATDAYGPPTDTLKMIDKAGEVEGLVALDINVPFEREITVDQVKEALDRNNIRCQAITPHSYTRKYRKGGLTNPDPAVRRECIDMYKWAVPIAKELGAKYVKFWPGQDGYDYPLQADYEQLWQMSVDGVREVAEAFPEMQFAIEYKFKEPRTHMFFCNAATTLHAIEDMGVPNVGIVMDLGHSLFARETPSEALLLAKRKDRLTSVEVNDNWREWDDDLAVGSVHLIETLEFLYYLRKIGWEEVILLDQFPFREDPVRAASESIETFRKLDAKLEDLDIAALKAAQEKQDALAAQRLALDLFLS